MPSPILRVLVRSVIFATTCDVRDLENLTKAVAEGVHELGRLDIVVANAGILSVAADSDVSEQMWQTMIDINLGGVWKTIKAATPHILAGGVFASTRYFRRMSTPT